MKCTGHAPAGSTSVTRTRSPRRLRIGDLLQQPHSVLPYCGSRRTPEIRLGVRWRPPRGDQIAHSDLIVAKKGRRRLAKPRSWTVGLTSLMSRQRIIAVLVTNSSPVGIRGHKKAPPPRPKPNERGKLPNMMGAVKKCPSKLERSRLNSVLRYKATRRQPGRTVKAGRPPSRRCAAVEAQCVVHLTLFVRECDELFYQGGCTPAPSPWCQPLQRQRPPRRPSNRETFGGWVYVRY
jgi:hypothetical protein